MLESDDHSSVRLFSLTMCRYALDTLKLGMNDTALCRIHRLHHILALVAQYLISSLVCHIDKHFFSVLSVSADIEDNTKSLLTVTVSNQIGKICDRIERLTVTADRCTAVLTVYRDMDHIFFTIGIEFAVDADTGKNFRYKRYSGIFRFTGFIAFERLVVAVVNVAVVLIFFISNLRGNANGNFLLAKAQETFALFEDFDLCLIFLHTEFGKSQFDGFLFRLCGLGDCLFHACLYLLAVQISPYD